MKYDEIMVRYGELSTKGKNKRSFIGMLVKNVRKALHDLPAVKIHGERDRMHLILNGEDSDIVIERLPHIFGIQNFSPVLKVERDVALIKEKSLEMIQSYYQEGMNFKVNTRRSDHEFELDTNEMNHLLGGVILKGIPGITVDVKKPDLTLRVEVRKEGIFLSCVTIMGAGGLPVGSSGKGVLMLSGGIDSPVAGYLALKRGIEIEAIHFHSPPYTSKRALEKAQDLSEKLTAYTGSITFIEVPFTEIQEEIKRVVPEGYLMTVTRRMMMRLTDEIRKQRNALAIINGESVGQVASQTLHSMIAINDVTNTPIIRPVVTMDKNEIIEIAQQIDTFDLSIQPFEDCCTIFAPPAPKTKPKLDKAQDFEARLDIAGLMERAMSHLVISEIKIGQNKSGQIEDEFTNLL